jgi:hypothetical protein
MFVNSILLLLGTAVTARGDDYASGAWRRSLDGIDSCWTGLCFTYFNILFKLVMNVISVRHYNVECIRYIISSLAWWCDVFMPHRPRSRVVIDSYDNLMISRNEIDLLLEPSYVTTTRPPPWQAFDVT